MTKDPEKSKGIKALNKYYPLYTAAGFKPLRLNGYNEEYQQKNIEYLKSQGKTGPEIDRYKIAKHPLFNMEKNFTAETYAGASLDSLIENYENDGWVGLVVAPGYIVLDVDKDRHSIQQVEFFIKNKNYKTNITKTQNGLHIYFKDPSGKIKGSDDVFVKAGFKITFRAGGKNYIIPPPSNGREWIGEVIDFKTVEDLPAPFQPLDKNNKDDLNRAVANQFKYCYYNKLLSGNADIDLAFMGWLVKTLGFNFAEAAAIFEMIYSKEYDEGKTRVNYDRAATMTEITGFKSLKESISKVEGLDYFVDLLNLFGKVHKKELPQVGPLTEEQLKLNIIGYNNSRNVLVWADGSIQLLSLADINSPAPYQLLTGVDVQEGLPWKAYKKSILAIAHQKGRVDESEKIKDGVWKINNSFFIISGLNVLKISNNIIEEVKTPVISKSESDGDNILLALNKRNTWLDINYFKQVFNSNADGPALLRSSYLKLLALVDQWCWKDKEMAPYVTAAVMLTALQHAMKWRPLLYVGGERDAGKSYFHDNIPTGLYSNLVKKFDKATPHSVAQTFGNTCKYMILDEFEKHKKIPQILELLKICGYGGVYTSGTPGEDALEFKIHHMPWLSSTQTHTFDAAQASRLVKFDLAKPSGRTPPELPTDDEMRKLGAEIIAALIKVWPALDGQYDFYHKNAKDFNCDNRMVRNVAYMAGVLNLVTDQDKTKIKLPAFLNEVIKEDRETIIDHILDSHIDDPVAEKGYHNKITVYEALTMPLPIQNVIGPKYGIKIYTDTKEKTWLVIYPELVQRNILKDMTEYKDGSINIVHSLVRIPGAEKKKMRLSQGRNGHNVTCVVIPIDATPISIEDIDASVLPVPAPGDVHAC